jgi:molecular chaperone DnaK
VTFDIDANGIVHVGAKDLGTGKEQSIKITASGGLNKDEIDQMVRDAAAHAEEDKRKRELIDARNQLDGLCYQTEKTLGEHKDSLDADARGQIETALADGRKALEGEDLTLIRSATDTLSRASHKLAEAMYAKASKGGAEADGDGGGEQPSSDAKPKDDVVEAEFEEVKD